MTIAHRRRVGLLTAILILLAACSDLMPTGTDSADQATSAQMFIPALEGYVRSDASSITDAITTLGGSVSLLSGNPGLTAAIAVIDGLIQCYENVGAIAAAIYTQPVLDSLAQGQGLSVGALAVINQERLARNFLACALPETDLFSAQADTMEPCSGSGTLLIANERIHYLYAATDPLLCLAFQNHFDAL
ncbi:MAG: hypothetical protein OXP68_05570 [Anaerolineaceae bacterium]|nr:hypothetical protein [Anaerolineaceae bacterium]MDE0327596.1 hypothetical protein [Anaerolineaceae bacterium]